MSTRSSRFIIFLPIDIGSLLLSPTQDNNQYSLYTGFDDISVIEYHVSGGSCLNHVIASEFDSSYFYDIFATYGRFRAQSIRKL